MKCVHTRPIYFLFQSNDIFTHRQKSSDMFTNVLGFNASQKPSSKMLEDTCSTAYSTRDSLSVTTQISGATYIPRTMSWTSFRVWQNICQKKTVSRISVSG